MPRKKAKPSIPSTKQARAMIDKNSVTIAKMVRVQSLLSSEGASTARGQALQSRLDSLQHRVSRRLLQLVKWADAPSRLNQLGEPSRQSRKPGRPPTSRFPNVLKEKDRWVPFLVVNGKTINMGRFDTEEEAHQEQLRAEAELRRTGRTSFRKMKGRKEVTETVEIDQDYERKQQQKRDQLKLQQQLRTQPRGKAAAVLLPPGPMFRPPPMPPTKGLDHNLLVKAAFEQSMRWYHVWVQQGTPQDQAAKQAQQMASMLVQKMVPRPGATPQPLGAPLGAGPIVQVPPQQGERALPAPVPSAAPPSSLVDQIPRVRMG